ncbi:unnamed protein product [Nesidiocoris tenuis]|uniref:Sulfatase N-terminal domain-containing protein n=1 Tax=Nesidiocoris tenuis TaxID=355587 RepID=A0A6H5FZA6_9HEMI|nr:unnamed protein product [Nesidiocoris tenuis]
MQHNVIADAAPWGLPLTEKLLPERLNELGYESHAIGKWHLGYFKRQYTPTFRGFATHFGSWSSHQDYFNHRMQAAFLEYEGLDLRDNMEPDWSESGNYTTRLLTEKAEKLIANHNVTKPLFLYLAHLAPHAGNFDYPLQAPPETVKMFAHVKPIERKKSTPWEGALRTVAAVWSQRISPNRGVMNHLMHLADWMPTLYVAGGGNVSDLGEIDGVSHWDFFARPGAEAPRNEILHNIDEITRYSAIRMGSYKYVNGTTFFGYLDGWYGSKNSAEDYNVTAVLGSTVAAILGSRSEKSILRLRSRAVVNCPAKEPGEIFSPCDPSKGPCLFNLEKDPCERNNLYGSADRNLIERMERRLSEFEAARVPAGNERPEGAGDPRFHNHTWTCWRDDEELPLFASLRF